jgi:uroporphyrinogen-III synthase
VDIPDFSSRKEIIVTFTSASTVTNFVEILRNCGLENQIGKISGYSIGPATSKKANELGVRIMAESNPHTIEALTETIVYHLKEQKHDIPDYKT